MRRVTEGATHVVATPALFYKTAALAPKSHAYPLEEINDYLRQFPERADAVRQTLSYYELSAFGPCVAARTLLMAGARGSMLDGPALAPLAASLKGPATVYESEQSTYKDGLYVLPEHWRD